MSAVTRIRGRQGGVFPLIDFNQVYVATLACKAVGLTRSTTDDYVECRHLPISMQSCLPGRRCVTTKAVASTRRFTGCGARRACRRGLHTPPIGLGVLDPGR